MKRMVHVVALGARTPVGLTAETAAAAVRGGICRLGAHPFIVDIRGDMARIAMDPRLDPELIVWKRMASLATGALGEVAAKVPLELVRSAEILVALPEARPGFSDKDAQKVVSELGSHESARGLTVVISGRGHAGALQAIAQATERLASGRTELCIVVGADSYADPDTFGWLDANKQLMGEGVPGAFVPGEAAGAIVLVAADIRPWRPSAASVSPANGSSSRPTPMSWARGWPAPSRWRPRI